MTERMLLMNDRARSSRASAVAVVFAASLAMAATLPARTYGLGLITTRLLDDLPSLDATGFAQLNLVATLISSLFCLPCGWLLDRFGVRPVLVLVMISLAGSVMAMSQATAVWGLAVMLTLSRGFGQSMLSVISVSMLGKWFGRNSAWGMGSFAVLMTVLLAAATGLLGQHISTVGWRLAWRDTAIALLVLTPITGALALRAPRGASRADSRESESEAGGVRLGDAVRSACFWIFAIGVSFFGMISAGLSLFMQLVLAERGLSEQVYHTSLIIGLITGMIANLVGGWLTRHVSMSRLLSVGLATFALSLFLLPLLRSPAEAYLQAVLGGVSGGLITVLFFAVWVHAYGPQNLGRIQGAAQTMTVLASAVGPLIVAQGQAHFGSFLPLLVGFAAVSCALAIAAWFVTVPNAAEAAQPSQLACEAQG